jgi:flagellar protein FliL
MGKLIPLLIILIGALGGAGAGFMLRPEPEEAPPTASLPDLGGADFVRLNNQFVVPVIGQGRVLALVVMSISIATDPGGSERVFSQEPRLRDAILQTLFNHANMGGFEGNFIEAGAMTLLRAALRETVQSVLGPMARDVLVVDIIRQDL